MKIYDLAFEKKKEENFPEDPQLACILYGLGILCFELENFMRGYEMLKKSLKIRKKLFGKENELIADCYNAIGVSFHGRFNHEQGLKYFLKSL